MSDQPLRRDIGSMGTAFLAFNGMVGAGIFALPATLAFQFGNFSPWLFPVFGLLIMAIAIPFARLASLFSVSGGPVTYVAPYGPLASFQTGWLYYIARATALAANANVFAAYAASLWPALDSEIGRGGSIIALIALMTWVNLVGVRRAIQALDLITLFKLLPLLGLAFWALAEAGPPAAGSLPQFGEVEAAALLTLYALIGFENCLVPAGETRNPRKTIPRAMLITIVATALLYFLIQLAYVAVMPPDAQPEAPLGALAGVLFGPVGMVILSVTALVSVSGNLLGAITSTPRLTYALSERALLPAWFG
ncbi:MAG TPA: APC family permease, partial [Sphingomicrobium sp.]